VRTLLVILHLLLVYTTVPTSAYSMKMQIPSWACTFTTAMSQFHFGSAFHLNTAAVLGVDDVLVKMFDLGGCGGQTVLAA
jgi:hypothetical protein